MASSINAYSVSLAMDASSYINSSKLSRRETQQLSRVINQSRTPMDKYERAVNSIDSALAKGAISQKTYNRLLDEQRNKFGMNAQKASKLNMFFTEQVKSLGAMAAGYMTLQGAIQVAQRTLASFLETLQKVDKVAKTARGIGASFGGLEALRLMGAETAGVDSSAIDTALQKMMVRIGQAQQGVGESAQTFKMLGLSVNELAASKPERAFAMIAQQLSKLPDQSTKAAVAMKLFEEAGVRLIPMLDQGAQGVVKYMKDIRNMGLVVGQDSVSRMEAFNDQLERTNLLVEGLRRQTIQMPGVMGMWTLAVQKLNSNLQRAVILMKGAQAAMRFLQTGSFNDPKVQQRREAAAQARLDAVQKRQRDMLAEIPRQDAARRAEHIASEMAKAGSGSVGANAAINPFLMENALAMRELPRHVGEAVAQAVAPTTAQAIEANSQEAIKFMHDARQREAQQKAAEMAEQKQQTKTLEENKRVNKLILDKLSEMGWGAV